MHVWRRDNSSSHVIGCINRNKMKLSDVSYCRGDNHYSFYFLLNGDLELFLTRPHFKKEQYFSTFFFPGRLPKDQGRASTKPESALIPIRSIKSCPKKVNFEKGRRRHFSKSFFRYLGFEFCPTKKDYIEEGPKFTFTVFIRRNSIPGGN